MKILDLVLERASINQIFKRSHEYYELRIGKKALVQALLDYEHMGVIPECVTDYCLEVLSERTRLK